MVIVDLSDRSCVGLGLSGSGADLHPDGRFLYTPDRRLVLRQPSGDERAVPGLPQVDAVDWLGTGGRLAYLHVRSDTGGRQESPTSIGVANSDGSAHRTVLSIPDSVQCTSLARPIPSSGGDMILFSTQPVSCLNPPTG